MRGRNGPRARCIGLTSAGLSALAEGDLRAAADSWIGAVDLAREETLPGALSAAVHNNAGAAYLIEARSGEALQHLQQARQHWINSLHALHAEPPQASGTNSVFHLQLAIKHHDTYAQLERDRRVRLCKAARTMTALNHSLVRAPKRLRAQHRAIIAAALSDAFGPRCPEIDTIAHGDAASMSADLVPALYQRKLDSLQGFAERQSATSANVIELAARLTILIHPILRCALAPRGHHPLVEKN